MPRGDHGGTSKGTGVRCVAANCGNTNADGVSLHYFPRDPTRRKRWTDFVQVKRVWGGPTQYSALCSNHFTEDCIPFKYKFQMEQMGTKPKRLQLTDDAVPTIHVETITTPSRAQTSTRRMPKLSLLSPHEELACQSSPPKKLRRGYLKREAARIIAAHENEELSQKERETCQEAMQLEEFDLEINTASTASVCCQTKPEQASKKCQTRNKTATKSKLVSRGTQTDHTLDKPATRDAFQLVRPEYFDQAIPQKHGEVEYGQDDLFSSPMKDDLEDPTFEPPSSPFSDGQCSEYRDQERSEPDRPTNNPHPESESKYIVFERNLLELFKICQKCFGPTEGELVYVNGSMVKVKQKCLACSHERFWFSQPFVGNKPAGNLIISAGILFSGSIPSKALRMLKFMKVSTISASTYMNHQRYFLYPAIAHVWNNYQQDYISEVQAQGRAIVVGGDGRSDTPGHSAKFGSYTMLDLEEGAVVDVQLVQSNEVKSSSHMEKEGLVRSVEYFKENNIEIKFIITDRHVQTVKWIKDNLTQTEHRFDVWHVAKGLKKKLVALSKEKDCLEVAAWIKSLTNHLYWTAATSAGEDSDVTIAKWLSVLNHIINVHSGHSAVFTTCQHGELEGRERQKKWLKPGTKVFEKLDDIISSRQMKRDIPMLSGCHQTSALEGYHSVINHFAPKMIGFSYHGMLSRLWLAALHFNENAQREQAYTAEGQPRYKITFPKFKRGEYTVRKTPVESTYEYVEVLMRTAIGLGRISHMNRDGFQLQIQVPPSLSSEYERPDRQMAVRSLLSRFNETQQHGSPCMSG